MAFFLDRLISGSRSRSVQLQPWIRSHELSNESHWLTFETRSIASCFFYIYIVSSFRYVCFRLKARYKSIFQNKLFFLTNTLRTTSTLQSDDSSTRLMNLIVVAAASVPQVLHIALHVFLLILIQLISQYIYIYIFRLFVRKFQIKFNILERFDFFLNVSNTSQNYDNRIIKYL